MLLYSITLLLLSNSVSFRRDLSILISRVSFIILLYSILLNYHNLHMLFLGKGIGIYGGLFHDTLNSHFFQLFIFLLAGIILTLTGFYPRKISVKEHASFFKLLSYKLIYPKTAIINKKGQQFKIIEYPLILIFVVTGASFLVSASDLVSIFLSIELQSYGLYLVSTLYRNSELATSGGLTYFLLGGLSSCFILLASSLLYANSGTTNLDSLYIITSISEITKDSSSVVLY